MRAIITSDWQCAPANIEECEKAHAELKARIQQYHPDVVLNLGDFKEAYDPIPGSVLRFWIRATREIRQMADYFALLGNHDRLSQSINSENWLDALQAAGAKTITEPFVVQSDPSMAFLPFADREKTIEWAAQLKADLLFFHCDVAGASGVFTDAVTPQDLRAHKYAACFGGHIHQHQRFAKNMWYVGSPFCMDWGEANQTKGVLLVDYKAGEIIVKQLPTKIPHWYDFDYLQSIGKQPEPGSYVRVKVPVSTKKVIDELHTAEKELLAQYGDVHVFAVPEMNKQYTQDDLLKDIRTDEQMLTLYISATLPEAARFKPEAALAYMQKILPPQSPTAIGGMHFLQVSGENVLCFEKIKIDFRKQGLVLLRGVNRAWPRRSNGAGKSSALSLLPLAFAGENIKEQKNDEWASDFNDDPAILRLWAKSASGKLFKIERRRRPHKLLFTVDGTDQSAGLTGKAKNETQGRIEEKMGFDLSTLLSSVYIDPTVANGFLFGTQKDRMDLVAKLQNLDRFEKALKATTADITVWENKLTKIESNQDKARERITLLGDQYRSMQAQQKSDLLTSVDDLQKEIDSLVEQHAELSAHNDFYGDLQKDVDEWTHEYDEQCERNDLLRANAQAVDIRFKTVEKLIAAGKCTQCGAAVTGLQQHELLTLTEQKAQLKKDLAKSVETALALRTKIDAAEKKINNYLIKLEEIEGDVDNKREELQRLSSAADKERDRLELLEQQRKAIHHRLEKLKAVAAMMSRKHKAVSVHLEMLQYAKAAFHRNGIPLALSIALCPVLNAAAEEYSSIFNSGKIKVRFSVHEGDFDAEVINTAGSTQTKGQSIGEAAMAGVITAFALQHAGPRCNLLILDEPGHGLDAEGQKEFAQGLMKIRDRYETMIVTTHSQIIESILGGETVWVVEKDNRVSRLLV